MKKYAIVGLGGRSSFFMVAIATEFKATAKLVAFCDTNQTRMDFANKTIKALNYGTVPTYKADAFDQMIKETCPDEVIVTTPDRTHHTYITRAMHLGCNVITEKPMTTTVDRILAITAAMQATSKQLRVTFNYRYAPHNTKIHNLLADGCIGQVNSVHFEWALNTSHGADYFRRWHRNKANSGGLLVHKSTHHFDLMNFWLQSEPATVFAMGDLKFYGKENAEARGVTEFYSRSRGSEVAKKDPFGLDLESSLKLKGLYLDAEHEDGYFRDQSVFGDGISIEDTLGVMVRYKSGTVLTYSLVAYSPWEGFRVAFNGSKGRLELDVVEMSYVSSGGAQSLEGALDSVKITLHPLWGQPQEIKVVGGEGGHGGGDPELLRDLFADGVKKQDGRAAGWREGAASILTGISGNLSIATGQVINVTDVLDLDAIKL